MGDEDVFSSAWAKVSLTLIGIGVTVLIGLEGWTLNKISDIGNQVAAITSVNVAQDAAISSLKTDLTRMEQFIFDRAQYAPTPKR